MAIEEGRAKYMQEYRKTPSGRAQLDAANVRAGARRRALLELAKLYPVEFDILFAQQLKILDDEARVRRIDGLDR